MPLVGRHRWDLQKFALQRFSFDLTIKGFLPKKNNRLALGISLVCNRYQKKLPCWNSEAQSCLTSSCQDSSLPRSIGRIVKKLLCF